MRSRLIWVQPVLASYRRPVLSALARRFDVTLLTDIEATRRQGFDNSLPDDARVVDAPIRSALGGRLGFQRRVLSTLIRQRPDMLLLPANPRHLSYWLSLLAARVVGVRVFSHGQGLYRHREAGHFRRAMYRLMATLSHRYICYTALSGDSMREIGCRPDRLAVAENSVTLDHTVPPARRTQGATGILFVGRLRAGCRLDTLFAAVEAERAAGRDITVHVVGDGPERADLQRRYGDAGWIVWHGAVFDEETIARISLACRVGCYPGDAGLSVVHFFGLSLPPIVHDRISTHMGPEPSYVRDGVNGFVFSQEEPVSSLQAILERIWALEPERFDSVRRQAFDTYVQLNAPPLGDRIGEVLLAHSST